jgi:hypothetical protein
MRNVQMAQRPLTHYALRITHYALRITHYALRITHYALRITHYALRITHYALRITHYALSDPLIPIALAVACVSMWLMLMCQREIPCSAAIRADSPVR